MRSRIAVATLLLLACTAPAAAQQAAPPPSAVDSLSAPVQAPSAPCVPYVIDYDPVTGQLDFVSTRDFRTLVQVQRHIAPGSSLRVYVDPGDRSPSVQAAPPPKRPQVKAPPERRERRS